MYPRVVEYTWSTHDWWWCTDETFYVFTGRSPTDDLLFNFQRKNVLKALKVNEDATVITLGDIPFITETTPMPIVLQFTHGYFETNTSSFTHLVDLIKGNTRG